MRRVRLLVEGRVVMYMFVKWSSGWPRSHQSANSLAVPTVYRPQRPPSATVNFSCARPTGVEDIVEAEVAPQGDVDDRWSRRLRGSRRDNGRGEEFDDGPSSRAEVIAMTAAAMPGTAQAGRESYLRGPPAGWFESKAAGRKARAL